MPSLEVDARVRSLATLQASGMTAVDARAIDAACAQYAQGDLDEYTLAVEECEGVWRTDRTLHPAQVVVRAVQPPPQVDPPSGAPEAGASGAHGSTPETISGQKTLEAAARDARRKARRTKSSICPKCKSTEFTTLEYDEQKRAADEGADAFRKCENPKCNYKWRVRGNEVNEKPRTGPARSRTDVTAGPSGARARK